MHSHGTSKSLPQVCECCLSTTKGGRCVPTAWGGRGGFQIRGSNAANPFIWITFPPRAPGVHRSLPHSGVAPLSLVVNASGKNSPHNKGRLGRWWWMAAAAVVAARNGSCFSPSWVIAMDRYVITTLCYVLWLGGHATRRLGGWWDVSASAVSEQKTGKVQENTHRKLHISSPHAIRVSRFLFSLLQLKRSLHQ